MEICFVRHGETDWNKQKRLQGITDIPLNETGVEQARVVANYLQNKKFEAVFTSPLSRAKQTAQVIADACNLPLTVLESFTERSFGKAEGMTAEEIRANFTVGQYPDEEPIDDFIERIEKGLEHVKTNLQYNKVLIVAHGAVINRLLSIYSNGEIGTGKTILHNTGLSYFQSTLDGWEITSYDQIEHL